MQQAAQKNFERAFSVLEACCRIICRATQFWRKKNLYYILKACIILLNMIVEDEGADASNVAELEEIGQPALMSNPCTNEYIVYKHRHRQLSDDSLHYQL
jgi:hypothetical protein